MKKSENNTGMLRELGAWLAGLRYEDIPENARRAARYQVLNMLATAMAARELPDTQAIAKATGKFSGAGKSTVVATGEKRHGVDAAMVNAAYSMAQDFDDIIWMGHTGHSAVFAPLAVAEQEGASTKEFLTAVVGANEIAGRLGASSFLGPLNGQMWTFIHLIGAAAGASKLLKLDAEQATNALAISLSQPNFALQPAFMTTSSKLLAASIPTGTGIQSAYYAREGITGHAGILEDQRGFWRRFSFVPMPYMLGELGQFWCIETLTFKTYPGCHYFQTACTAIERLRARHPALTLDKISSIRIETTKLGFEVTRFAKEYGAGSEVIDHVNMNFDLATTTAVLLHAGRLTSAETDPEWLERNTAEILRWRGKIRVEHSPEMTARVLASAKALPTGRRGLAELSLRQIAKLRKAYSSEYRSNLLNAKELTAWLKLAVRPKATSRADSALSANGIPLYFPSRVSIKLDDGRVDSEQVDLPVGSLASPDCESKLERKVAKELSREIFHAGLKLEHSTLHEFCAMIAGK